MSKAIQHSLNLQGCLVKEMVLSGTEQAVAKLEVSVVYITEYTNL